MASVPPQAKISSARFLIEAEVGRGGNGIVYRAWDQESKRTVALKVIAADAGVAPEDEARLTREGQILTNLAHPAIVGIVAFGRLEETGQPFVAMEWLEGEDLAARQRRDPLTIPQAIQLAIFVAEALEAAHAAGVVHRDIKPGNIFLCKSGVENELGGYFPKLVDFGVAAKGDIRITHSGDVVGTPAYMAPEQARGDAPIDARADTYALGATLFELIAGRPPHVGPNWIATLARLVTTDPPRLSELCPDTPPPVDDLVFRMLQKDPAERPSSIPEVLEVLKTAAQDPDRASWHAESGSVEARSSRLGSSATRLITTIVALNFPSLSARERALENLRQRGADAVPLGKDAIVAHLGARRALGNEASAALDWGRRLARAQAQVGVASGRARFNYAATGVQPVGEVVDRAAALARDAESGVVIADTTTSELGRGRFEFRSRDDGSAVVGEPVRGPRGDRTFGAPFVGRDPELAQVLSAFQRSKRDSTPVVVTITGPPGIGKSRLRREVMARIATSAEAPLIVLQRSEAYAQGHALGAAADVLRAIVALPKGATSNETISAIEARLGSQALSELSEQQWQLLAKLLANEALPQGFDQRGFRDTLWLAMTDALLQITAKQQAAILMEDLQWADPESLGWLDHMLGRAGSRPIVVMAMVRPEFWNDPAGRFIGRDHIRIELRPISRRASNTIARSVLGEEMAEEVIERISEQAAGLPLFAEELARLAAAGRDPTGAPTIEAAIQVSLDALDEECRDAVGRLSVFGLSSWDSGLEALGMNQAESLMKALVAGEILVEQNVSRFTSTREWQFKHALVREVAYASLGVKERQELHALAAQWLATMGEDAATVAGHYDLGGNPVRAAEYWARAAERSIATNALQDALSMAERALAFAEDKPSAFRRALCLDEAWSRLDPRASERESAIIGLESNVHDEASAVRAQGARARYEDARGAGVRIDERLAQTRDEARALGLHDEEARCSAALASRLAFAGRFLEAELESLRLLELSENCGIRSAAVDGYQTQAIIRQTQGALAAALEARRNAVAAARGAGLKEREAMLMTNLGFALTTIGARQEARSSLEQGLALADAIGSKGAVRHAQMNLLGWAATFGNDRLLEVHLAEVRADADASASGVWAPPDRANLGVLFYRGCELLRAHTEASTRKSLGLLRMSAHVYRATGNRDVLPVALATWAEAERRTANLNKALELAEEAAQLLNDGAPSLLNESVVYLVLHDCFADQGDKVGAKLAIASGIPAMLRRVQGLTGTPYARQFLTDRPDNARFLAIGEEYALIPDSIHRVLEGSGSR